MTGAKKVSTGTGALTEGYFGGAGSSTFMTGFKLGMGIVAAQLVAGIGVLGVLAVLTSI